MPSDNAATRWLFPARRNASRIRPSVASFRVGSCSSRGNQEAPEVKGRPPEERGLPCGLKWRSKVFVESILDLCLPHGVKNHGSQLSDVAGEMVALQER